MTQHRRIRPVLAGLLALGLAAGALGQTPPAASSGKSTELPAPTAIPLGQISAESRATAARLEEIEAQRPAQALERVGARLQELQVAVPPVVGRAENVLSRPAFPGELEAQTVNLRALARRFDALDDQIGGLTDRLDKSLSEIADQTQRWKLTLEQARSTRAPPAVERQAEQSLAALALAKKQVGDDLASAVALQSRVRGAARGVRVTMGQVQAAQNALAAQLFARQEEPLWRSIPSAAVVAAIPGAIGGQISDIWAELVSYAGERRDAMIVQALIFLALAWLLSRARAARVRLHPELAAGGSDGLAHPWAAAFIIAALLTPFLHLRTRGFQLLIAPLALIAWFRVLSATVPSSLRVPLVGLGVLALLEVFRVIVTGIPVVDRGFLGLDLALGLAGILWLRRPSRMAHVPWREASGPWVGILSLWMRVTAPTLAAGLLALVLGYTILANRIAFFAIWGTLLGAAWVTLVRIGEEVAEQAIEGSGLARLRMVRVSRPGILRLLRRVLRTFGVVGWMYATFTLVGLWSPAGSVLGAALSTAVGYGPVSISLGGVIAFFLTLWVSWLLARFTSFALDQEVFTRVRMPPGVPFALSTFTRYAILVIGFVLAMGAIGFSLDRVTLLLSAVGVGIGFGLQNVVNNFVSGAILLFERPIRMGDWVQLGDLFGTVSAIGIRASKVRTFDGADVIVPNGDFVSAQVINWTLSDRKRRIILPVGVAYGTKPRQVIEILEQVARSHPDVLDDPVPVALFRGFGDSSLDFELRTFTEGDWLVVTSDLAVAISEALEVAGITIPFPQRDLYLRNIPELRDALEEVARSARAEPRGLPAGPQPGVGAPPLPGAPAGPREKA